MNENADFAHFPLLLTPDNVLEQVLKSMALLDLNKFSLVSKKTESLADIKSIQFSILSMPRSVLLEILTRMWWMDLLSFTLASKKTKQFVHAEEFKPTPIDFYVSNKLEVYVTHIRLFSILNPMDPDTVLRRGQPGFKRKYPKKETLANLFLLTKQTTVRWLLFEDNFNENYMNFVFGNVPICQNVIIFPNVPGSAQKKILAQYRNATKQISLSTPPVECRNELVLRNLEFLSIHSGWVALEHLLMANSASLGLYRLDSEVLNKFLKLWIKKRSSSRLEYLWTDRVGRVVGLKKILAGIDYKIVSKETIRTFKHSKKAIEGADWLVMTDTMEVRGGYDFRRRDGTLATITVRQRDNKRRVEFFVWN